MNRRRLTDAELEATLRDIGARLRTPETPHLAARVRARITERPEPARRPWIFALAPAVLTLLVIGAGATATELVRLRGVDVVRVPAVSAPPVSSPPVSATPIPSLDLGVRATIDSVRGLPGLRTSLDPVFAAPDEIYVRTASTGRQVSFVYRARTGLPAGPTGHGALVGQFPGALDATLIGKGVGPNTRVERTNVGSAPAIWIEGETHFFFYRDPAGNILQESLRLAGNALLWERDGQLLRLEAQVSKERALEIAASFR